MAHGKDVRLGTPTVNVIGPDDGCRLTLAEAGVLADMLQQAANRPWPTA